MALSKVNPFSVNKLVQQRLESDSVSPFLRTLSWNQEKLDLSTNMKEKRCLRTCSKTLFLFSSVLFCSTVVVQNWFVRFVLTVCNWSVFLLLGSKSKIILFITDQYVTRTIYMPGSNKNLILSLDVGLQCRIMKYSVWRCCLKHWTEEWLNLCHVSYHRLQDLLLAGMTRCPG